MPISANNTLSLDGKYVTGKKCGVFAHLPTPANTTVTTADTYYPIQGNFTNSPMEDFSLATDKLQYDGTKTQYFEIDWHATVAADDASTQINIGIKVNGTLCDSSVMGTYLKNAGQFYAISGTSVCELSTGDTVQLVLTTDGDGDVITVQHFTTTLSEFFD